jgi:hypothetical protein
MFSVAEIREINKRDASLVGLDNCLGLYGKIRITDLVDCCFFLL